MRSGRFASRRGGGNRYPREGFGGHAPRTRHRNLSTSFRHDFQNLSECRLNFVLAYKAAIRLAVGPSGVSQRRLANARDMPWDYKNVAKRTGVLARLRWTSVSASAWSLSAW